MTIDDMKLLRKVMDEMTDKLNEDVKKPKVS